MKKLLDTFDTFVSHPLTLASAMILPLAALVWISYLTKDVEPGTFAAEAAEVTAYMTRPSEVYRLQIAYINQ